MNQSKNIIINFDELRQSSRYREKICSLIYQSIALKNSIESFIMANGGKDSDIDELFQESIVRFFNKSMQIDFELNTTPEAYIYGIARNVYYSQKKISVPNTEVDTNFGYLDEPNYFDDIDLFNIVQQILEYTTETCKQVLIFWSNNYKMVEIARLMSYKSEMMARKKKHECLQKLIKFLKENPAITQKIIENE